MSIMAGNDNTRNVQVVLSGQVDGFQRSMQAAGATVNSLASAVTSLGRKVENLAQRTGRRLIFFSAADVAGLTAAAEATNRLDVAMSNFRSTAVITGQSTSAALGSVQRLARVIPDSTNNIARLMGEVQDMGITGTRNLQNFTAMAERLGAATNTQPGELLHGVIQLNREMGSGLSTVDRYSSSLVELSKSAGVPAQNILAFSNLIDAVAQQAGYTETQVLGLATAFNRAGADSGQAANVFTNITAQINQALATNSNALNTFAHLAGLTRQQFIQLARGNPAQAFLQILEGIQHQGKNAIVTLNQLGLDGPRSLRVIAALTSGQANIAQQMNTASQAFDRNNALTKASNASWDTFAATMQKFRNEMHQIVTTIGGPFLAVLNTMFKAITGIVDAFQSIPGVPVFEQIIGGALAVIAPLAAMLGLITKIGPAMLLMLAAWRNLSGATGANLTAGFASGLRGRPTTLLGREFSDERLAAISGSPYQQRLFGGASRIGGFIRDRRLSPGEPSALGRVARSVAMFPVTKLRGEVGEAIDTARPSAFFDYTQRNVHANPYSMLSMIKRAEEMNTQAQTGMGQWWSQTRFATPLQTTTGRLRSAAGRGLDTAGSFLGSALGRFFPTHGGMPPTESTVKVNADTSQAQAKVAKILKEANSRATIKVAVQQGVVGRAQVAEEGMSPILLGGGRLGRLGSMAGATARAGAGMVSGLFSGLGTLSSAISSVALPLTILGTAGTVLYHVFSSMATAGRKYADNLEDLGAQAARTAGGSYTKPLPGAGQPPADRIKPFSTQQEALALGGSFQAANSSDISQLRLFGGNLRRNAAQVLVDNLVRNNSGQQLSQSQRTALQEELIAAYGRKNAPGIYKELNLAGLTGPAAGRNDAALAASARNNAGFFQGPYQGKREQSQFRIASESTANAITAGGAGSFARAGQTLLNLNRALQLPPESRIGWERLGRLGGEVKSEANRPNVQQFRGFIEQLMDQLNKGRPSDQQIHINRNNIYNLTDFINSLQSGNQTARNFAAGLKAAGLNVNDLSGSMKALNDTLTGSAAQTPTSPLGKLLTSLGVSYTSTQDTNYQRNIFLGQTLAQMPSSRNTPVNSLQAPAPTDIGATTRGLKGVEQYVIGLRQIGDPAAANAAQMIQNLNGQLQQQVGLFQDASQQAQTYAGVAHMMVANFGNIPEAAPDVQASLNQANAANMQGIATLRAYVTQIHTAHIQIQREEQDHNTQLARTYRDFNVQQKEAFYQRNLQVRQQLHDFSEQIRQMNFQTEQAFGNGAQMVPSQYTESASNALIGMNQQVNLLKESLTSLNTLRREGVSANVIRMLGLDDPTNADQAARYVAELAQNPSLVRAWNASARNRFKLANMIDTHPDNSKYRDMKRQFDYQAKLASDAFGHSQKLTNEAFQRSLHDFQRDYSLSQQRAEQDLQRTGENLYTNLNDLLNAAQHTGIKNIQTFASRLHTAIASVRHDTNAYLRQAIRDANNAANNIGGGPGAPVNNTPLSGTVTGGVNARGRAVGDTGVVGQQRNVITHGRNEGTTTTTKRSWVKPGTGFTYKGGDTSTGASANYRPSDQFMRQHPANPSFNKSIARAMAPNWGKGDEWNALLALWNQESGWNQYADNPTSSAYGIPQALPGTKMSPAGKDWRTNPATQIAWGLSYIAGRYGDPITAEDHERKYNWYAGGSVFQKPTMIGVGEAGPEAVIPLDNRGASFVATVVNKVAMVRGFGRNQVAMTNTMPKASVVINGNITHSVNHNANFTGAITVQSQDPNEMARKLSQKKRLAKLTNPMGVR